MIELAQNNAEKCILVGVTTRLVRREELEESLKELELLADTAGAEVVARITQDLDRIGSATFIGKGKVEELRTLVQEKEIPLVIFDDDLNPAQMRNLEQELNCKVVDRSGLILDIFASRARTMEAKTQVELAQLEYLLPRLTRLWTHLSKQFGGIRTKGPGETQIETDRRLIRTRISHLKNKLGRIEKQRITQRKERSQHTRAALVGYTNVGKSTLLNLLSGSDVFVENRLFATLDPTTRIVPLSSGTEILITDTVGFIRKLPHQLIASFRSTLEETTEADILLHIVDVSHKYFEDQIQTVIATLEDLGVHDKPTVMVFNKVDLLTDRSIIASIAERYPGSVFISATRGINILGLKDALTKLLQDEFCEEHIALPQHRQKLLNTLYTLGEVLEKTYENNDILLRLRIRKKERAKILSLVGNPAIDEFVKK